MNFFAVAAIVATITPASPTPGHDRCRHRCGACAVNPRAPLPLRQRRTEPDLIVGVEILWLSGFLVTVGSGLRSRSRSGGLGLGIALCNDARHHFRLAQAAEAPSVGSSSEGTRGLLRWLLYNVNSFSVLPSLQISTSCTASTSRLWVLMRPAMRSVSSGSFAYTSLLRNVRTRYISGSVNS